MPQQSIVKRILALALPMIGALLAQTGLEMVDSVMMGRLGYQQLAGGGLATSTFIILIITTVGLMNAVGISVAKARVEADSRLVISKIMTSGFHWGLVLSVFLIVTTLCIPKVLLLGGQSPEIVAIVWDYLKGVVWGTPAILLFLWAREYIAAHEKSLIIFIVSFLMLPLNAVLNYLLMYGFAFIPPLGITGIGYASAIVEWCAAATLLRFVAMRLPFQLNTFEFDSTLFKAIFKLGMPISITMVLEIVLFSAATFLAGYLGSKPLAVHQIALQYTSMTVMLPYGLAQAAAILIAQVHSQTPDAMPEWIKKFTWIALAFAVSSALLFVLVPEYLVGFFIYEDQHPDLLAQGVILLHIAALYQLCDALQVLFNGILRGLKDTFLPMCLNFLSYILLGLGSSVFLAFVRDCGLFGIWVGLAIGVTFASLFLVLRTYYLLKRTPNV